MTIIGKTPSGFIIQATEKEIANLCGYYSATADSKIGTLQAGAEIKVNEMFQQLYKLSFMKQEVMEVQNKLREYANALDRVVPFAPTIETIK